VSRDVRSDGRRPRGLVREGQSLKDSGTLFVGVVHAADGVRYSAAAGSRKELIQRLAEYARQRGDHVLLPDHARHLRSLLARRELEAAVELYFGLVGQRWDEEWLVTAVVNPAADAQIAAVVGEVALRDALAERPRLRDAS
jgi:hypothetical protein